MISLEFLGVKCFNALCFTAAFIMMIKGTVKYWMDENASVINYQAFHETTKDIYPTFSICLNSGKTIIGIASPLNDPAHNVELYNLSVLHEKYGLNQTSAEEEIHDYIQFLTGRNTTYGINGIELEYDDITIDLNDYLELAGIVSGDRILYEWRRKRKPDHPKGGGKRKSDDSKGGRKRKPDDSKKGPFKISYRHPVMKCFSMDISENVMDDLQMGKTLSSFAFTMDYNVSIFQKSSMLTMAYYLHYPNQLMRSNALEIVQLGKDTMTFRKQFWVDTVEVIRHRNSRHSPCKGTNSNDDELIRKKLIKTAKCTPPHWPADNEFKERCETVDQMLQVLTPSLETANPGFLHHFKDEQPCDQLHAVSFTFKELAIPADCSNVTVEKRSKDGKHHTPIFRNKDGKPPPPGDLFDLSLKKFGPNSNYIPVSLENKTIPKDTEKGRCVHPGIKSVEIHFKSSHYKEIKQIKDFCLESWIGNVGGYMGLFLGYAICQFPEMIKYFLIRMRKL